MYKIVIRAKHFDHPEYVDENINNATVKGIHTVVFSHDLYTRKNFNIDRIIAKIFNFFGRSSMPVRTITLTPANQPFWWKALDGQNYLIHDGRLTWIPADRVLNTRNLKRFGYATHLTDTPPSAKTEREVEYYKRVAQVCY